MSTQRQQRLDYVTRTVANSPLYSTFTFHLENDWEIRVLRELVNPDQPPHVLFFSAINYLLFRDHRHELAAFYPVLCPEPRPAAEAYPAFRDFCLTHRRELERLLPGARLQTNEVTRCANLLPAFGLVSRRGGDKPLVCFEIGCSGGLNLNWPSYEYIYDGETPFLIGDAASPVHIPCRLDGDQRPPFPSTMPTVAQSIGIELFPLTLTSEEDQRWLRACIWPEEISRYRLLDAAMTLAQQYPPDIRVGDASYLLPGLLEADHTDQTICVYHSFALNQGPAEIRAQVLQTLTDFSHRQTIYRVSIEAPLEGNDLPKLELFTYQGGALVEHEWLATCAIHGEQMQWQASQKKGTR